MRENILNFDETIEIIEDELLEVFKAAGGCNLEIFDECFIGLKEQFLSELKDKANLVYVNNDFKDVVEWQVRYMVNTSNHILDVLSDDMLAKMAERKECVKDFFDHKNELEAA